MLVILIMVAGVAMMVGAKAFAGKLLKLAIATALVLAMLPCLIQECRCALLGAIPWTSAGDTSEVLWLALLYPILTFIGFVAWRRRAISAKSRELAARRNGSARVRALPPAGAVGGSALTFVPQGRDEGS